MSKLKTLHERRIEAEKVLATIKKMLDNAEREVAKAASDLNNAQKFKKDFEKLRPSIERTSRSAERSIARLRKERDRVSTLLAQVNKFYKTKFEPLSAIFNDRETGIAAKIREGKSFSTQLSKLKTESKRQYTQIEKQIRELTKGLQEVVSIQNNIKALKKEVESNHASSEQYVSKIEAIFDRVESSSANIKVFEKEAASNNDKIKELLNSSETSYSNILTIHENAESTLDKINQIYEIAGDTGLGGEFDKRRVKLTEELTFWNKRIFRTTSVLLTLILLLFVAELWAAKGIITDITFDTNFYIRFLITSPIIYYLVFVHHQYNRTKALHEKYAFKTTLAFSLLAHIKTLTDNDYFGPESTTRIVNFILNGFYKIYDEPYLSTKEPKLKRKFNSLRKVSEGIET